MATWATLIANKAMDIAESYETTHGRVVSRVHKKGVGYDLLSTGNEERLIEVKGSSEPWKNYFWQSLHKTTYEALKNNPKNFFIYIVHFDLLKENRTEEYLDSTPPDLFVLPGEKLLSEDFRIMPQSYALTPISRTSLRPFSVENPVAVLPEQNL